MVCGISINGMWTMDTYTQKKKLEPFLVPHTKITSKWIIDRNVKANSIKLLKEHIGINLCDLGLGKIFVNMTLCRQYQFFF